MKVNIRTKEKPSVVEQISNKVCIRVDSSGVVSKGSNTRELYKDR